MSPKDPKETRTTGETQAFETNDLGNYIPGKQIGKGAYAVVRESRHKQTQELVAIKQYERKKLLDFQRKKQVVREVQILGTLDHPNIVRFREAFECHDYMNLVMDCAQGI